MTGEQPSGEAAVVRASKGSPCLFRHVTTRLLARTKNDCVAWPFRDDPTTPRPLDGRDQGRAQGRAKVGSLSVTQLKPVVLDDSRKEGGPKKLGGSRKRGCEG